MHQYCLMLVLTDRRPHSHCSRSCPQPFWATAGIVGLPKGVTMAQPHRAYFREQAKSGKPHLDRSARAGNQLRDVGVVGLRLLVVALGHNGHGGPIQHGVAAHHPQQR